MGWFSDFLSDPIGKTVDTVTAAVDSTLNAVTNHPLETAAVVAAVATANPELALTSATAEAGSAAIASDATTAAVSSGIVEATSLGTLDASTAALTSSGTGMTFGGSGLGLQATQAQVLGSANSIGSSLAASTASSGWTWGQIAAATNSGLNLGSSLFKLGSLSKMNAPSTSGLTSALSNATPSTVVTTPNGPEIVPAQGIGATTIKNGATFDPKMLVLLAVVAGGIYYMSKHKGA